MAKFDFGGGLALVACARLGAQFALAAALVIGTSMAVLGSWVAGRIEKGVVEHAATNATLHLDSFVEPQLQTLANGEQLSEEAERRSRGTYVARAGRALNPVHHNLGCRWGDYLLDHPAARRTAPADAGKSRHGLARAGGRQVRDGRARRGVGRRRC